MGLWNLLNSLETRLDAQEQVKRMDMMDMMVGRGHVNNERKVFRRKSVSLDSDMAGGRVAYGEIHLGDQRWTRRRHGVYQEVVGEVPVVCPYSQQVRDLELPRLLQGVTNIYYFNFAANTACLLFILPSSFLLST
jgi:hypothetical protein